MEKEDGEMSDDNAMLVDDDDNDMIKEKEESSVIYKSHNNGIEVEQLERVDAAKLDERAKRFGLNLTGNRVITQKQIDELYSNFGIESGNERHFRFDSLHLSGVEGLSTKEIFEYLEDYKPVSLEWISNASCNIVCQDHIAAALALLVHSREINNENLKDMLAQNSSHHWREGMPHPKQDLILFRFSTNSDKKIPMKNIKLERKKELYDQSMNSSKNPWGDLCQSWGVYDHQEVFNRKPIVSDEYEDHYEQTPFIQTKNKKLALRLGKRRLTDKEEDSDSDSEWKKKTKTPRMRMHADDEESKHKKKSVADRVKVESDAEIGTFAPLSIEVVNSKSSYTPRTSGKLSDKFKYHNKPNITRESILSRLGVKVTMSDDGSSDGYSSTDSGKNTMSRVQKINNQLDKSKNSSVWSRLESTSASPSDLRQRIKCKPRKQSKSDDLRDRLSKSKQSNLRIEIDNNYTSD